MDKALARLHEAVNSESDRFNREVWKKSKTSVGGLNGEDWFEVLCSRTDVESGSPFDARVRVCLVEKDRIALTFSDYLGRAHERAEERSMYPYLEAGDFRYSVYNYSWSAEDDKWVEYEHKNLDADHAACVVLSLLGGACSWMTEKLVLTGHQP